MLLARTRARPALERGQHRRPRSPERQQQHRISAVQSAGTAFMRGLVSKLSNCGPHDRPVRAASVPGSMSRAHTLPHPQLAVDVRFTQRGSDQPKAACSRPHGAKSDAQLPRHCQAACSRKGLPAVYMTHACLHPQPPERARPTNRGALEGQPATAATAAAAGPIRLCTHTCLGLP